MVICIFLARNSEKSAVSCAKQHTAHLAGSLLNINTQINETNGLGGRKEEGKTGNMKKDQARFISQRYSVLEGEKQQH